MYNFRGILTFDTLSDFPENGDEKYYYIDLSTEKTYTYSSGVYTERFAGPTNSDYNNNFLLMGS
jgi:hypothetical protein